MKKLTKCIAMAAGVGGGCLAAAIIRNKVKDAIDLDDYGYYEDDEDVSPEDSESDSEAESNDTKEKTGDKNPSSAGYSEYEVAPLGETTVKFRAPNDKPIKLPIIMFHDPIVSIRIVDGEPDNNAVEHFVNVMTCLAADGTSDFFKTAVRLYVKGVLEMTLLLPAKERSFLSFHKLLLSGVSATDGVDTRLDLLCDNGTYGPSESYRLFRETTPVKTRLAVAAQVLRSLDFKN